MLDDIRDVVFRRCRVEAPLPFIAPLAGVNIASVDGARVENVRVDAMTMTRACCPVFIRLGARWKNVPLDQRRAGAIEFISIEDVDVTSIRQCLTLAGLSGQPLRNIRLQNIRVENWDSTASSHSSSDIPAPPAAYPEATMFGKLPASLVFARHVEGLQIHAVTLKAAGDRHVTAILKEDVTDDLPIPSSP